MTYVREHNPWVDSAGQQVKATTMNGIDNALTTLFGIAPATNGALVWDGTQFRADAGIKNANVDSAAAIAYSKLALTGSVVNADIASGAAIAKSKLASLAIADADVAAGAAIAASKLANYPTDAQQVLKGDGTWGRNIYKPTLLTWSNSAAEKDLFGTDGSGFSIPGNVMGATGILRATVVFDYLQNTGGNRTLAMKIKFGATTLYDSTGGPVNLAASATHKIGVLQFWIANTATNAQSMGATFFLGDASGSTPTTGIGDPWFGSIAAAASTNNAEGIFGSSAPTAVDTTAANNLRATLTFDAATATSTITTRVALIEVL